MKLKICGMKYNTQEVAALQPDYLGFIFYEGSPRNFNGEIPQLPKGIKKVGVFVDADIAFAKANIEKYQLDIVQLHGNESPEYIKELKNSLSLKGEGWSKGIWKVFGIKDTFDFDRLIPYESLVDAFLFDTKGKEKGGNGYTFNWHVLKEYPSQTPFILSGGIGLEEIDNIKEILGTMLPILALDVNSKFEDTPGQKNIELLATFTSQLTSLLPRKD
jgi:phosphoribosylanthranilate isomerase